MKNRYKVSECNEKNKKDEIVINNKRKILSSCSKNIWEDSILILYSYHKTKSLNWKVIHTRYRINELGKHSVLSNNFSCPTNLPFTLEIVSMYLNSTH